MDGRTRGYDVVFYHDVPHVLDSMMTISHKEQDTHVASDACRARAHIERAGRVEEEREGASRKGEVLPHRIARPSSFVVRRSSVVSSNPTGIRLELDAIGRRRLARRRGIPTHHVDARGGRSIAGAHRATRGAKMERFSAETGE